MHDMAPLIYDLAIMLGVAAIVVLTFQRIRQPVVLGYLVAGFIIGPHTPPYALVTDIPNIQILSELGVIFLMFSLGLEFSFKKLMRVGVSASFTGAVEVAFMILAGFIAGRMMGWDKFNSLFLGAALSISSTTIIIKAIDELKLKTARFAELVFGILIVEDLLAIILLVGLSTFVLTNDVLSYNMLSAVIKLMLVVGSWFLIGYFFVPKIFRSIAGYVSQETLTITSVALCLLMVSIAAKFHYSTALGAFIMGSILAETKLVHHIHEAISPIRDIFAAVFFISVGMLIDPVIIVQEWRAILFISVITIITKPLITGVGAFITGQSLQTSIRSGFSMAQIGEFSFIIVALGVALNVVGNKIYPLVVAVSAITTFTTPYMIRISGYMSDVANKRMPAGIRMSLHNYTNWACHMRASKAGNRAVKSAFIRLFINGIIVAVIFTLIGQFIFPYFSFLETNTWQAHSFGLFIALIIASPFIWGMMFSFKPLNIVSGLREYLHPAVLLIWLITLSEIALLSVIDFNSWLAIVLFIPVVIIFFAIMYRQLEKSYGWFEHQLMQNIDLESHDQPHSDKAALKDIHFVTLHVTHDSPLVGLTIQMLISQHDFNGMVVGIERDGARILYPEEHTKVAVDDLLLIVKEIDKMA